MKKKTPSPKTARAPKKPAARRAKRAAPQDALRDQINVLAIIDALEQHVMGRKKMTSTQVSAALALLKKTLPDITENARKSQAAAVAASHEDALSDLE
jgi:hypothetical protein